MPVIQFWWGTTKSLHFSFYFLAEKRTFLEYEPESALKIHMCNLCVIAECKLRF